jgi:hypothetical protein
LYWARTLLKEKRLQPEIRHFKRHGQAILASLLVGLVLLLNAMAAAPELHALIHHDADASGHECAVLLFAHGHLDSATVEAPVNQTLIPLEPAPLISFSAFSPAIENLPAGRAPPVYTASPV